MVKLLLLLHKRNFIRCSVLLWERHKTDIQYTLTTKTCKVYTKTAFTMFLRTEVCLLLKSGITLLETPGVSLLSSAESVSDLRTYGDLRIPDSKPEALPTE